MAALRAIWTAVFVAIALVAALGALLMTHIGRDITDRELLVAAAARTLATPAGRAAVADVVVAEVTSRVGTVSLPVPVERIRATMGTAAGSPDVRAAVAAAVASGHDALIDDPGRGLTIPTGALRPALIRLLGGAAVAAGVPAAADFPPVTVPVPEEAQPLVRALGTVNELWPLTLVVALAATALAASLGRARPALIAVGTGLVMMAAVPPIAAATLPGRAARAAGAENGSVARAFAQEITGDWALPALTCVGAGLLLVVLGRLLSRAGGRSRTA